MPRPRGVTFGADRSRVSRVAAVAEEAVPALDAAPHVQTGLRRALGPRPVTGRPDGAGVLTLRVRGQVHGFAVDHQVSEASDEAQSQCPRPKFAGKR